MFSNISKIDCFFQAKKSVFFETVMSMQPIIIMREKIDSGISR